MRIPGLSTRHCTGSSNNLMPRVAKLSAIYATAKAILERLYLVPGLCQFASFVFIPSAHTPPPLILQLFLDFSAFDFYPRVAAQFLCQQVTWASSSTPNAIKQQESFPGWYQCTKMYSLSHLGCDIFECYFKAQGSNIEHLCFRFQNFEQKRNSSFEVLWEG